MFEGSAFLADLFDEPGELFHFGRQLRLPGLFKRLKVRIVADGHGQAATEDILELAAERRDHLVPRTDLLDQLLNTALFPEPAFVADPGETAELFGLVQQGDHGKVTAQEVRHPAAAGITRVLRFTVMLSST